MMRRPSRRDVLLALATSAAAACTPTPRRARGAVAVDLGDGGSLSIFETSIGGRIGLFALDTGNGRTVSYRQAERFAMCSTFKWVLAAAVLARVDRGELTLDAPVSFGPANLVEHSPTTSAEVAGGAMTVEQLAKAAVTVSDNTAANLLLDRVGGPVGLTRFCRGCGDVVTRLDRYEPELNENELGDVRDTTSPRAMAGLLEAVLLGRTLAPESRHRLVAWMGACETGRARLRAGLPPRWAVGDKTGTGSHGACNDVAFAIPPGRAPILVAALLEGTAAPDRLEAVHVEIARLVAARLG
jgi:beta-lactamase class A